MGITVKGCSNLEIKPIPNKYKGIIRYKKPLNIYNITKSSHDENYKKELLALSIIINGAEHNFLEDDCYDKYGEIKESLDVHPDVEVSTESYKWYQNEVNNNLYYVDWTTNMAYFKMESSKTYCVDRSYSGMGNFCKTIQQFTKERFYFPCDDMLNTSICIRYSYVMRNVWQKWKETYFPEVNLPENLDDINEDNYVEYLTDRNNCWELEFFMSLFIVLKYGASCGMVLCC